MFVHSIAFLIPHGNIFYCHFYGFKETIETAMELSKPNKYKIEVTTTSQKNISIKSPTQIQTAHLLSYNPQQILSLTVV